MTKKPAMPKAQRDAMEQAYHRGPVAVVATTTATALIEKGYAAEASIAPAPLPKNTAISLTIKGRSWAARNL